MTDKEMTALIKKSPDEAFSLLVHEYGNLVYTIVLSKLRGCCDHREIKECVSDIFVEVFCSIDNFSPERGSLKNFLCAVARNTALGAFHRQSYRKSKTVSLDDEEAELLVSRSDTEDEAIGRVSGEQLYAHIKSLGEPDSVILIYQYYYELKVREIAARLSMTPAAVQKRSIRARERLKEILMKGMNEHEK